MDPARFGVLELLLFFGVPILLGLRELWALRRDERRERERAAAGARRDALPAATQRAASDERGTGAG